jgi:hypothetical protein
MLDLSGYKLTFDEEFNSLSISQGAGTVWSDIRSGSRLNAYADIGFGDSAFVDPGSGINPFSLQNGALNITAVPAGSDIVGPGHWASGLISTEYSISQEYGYFEMRAMLPGDDGVWPAFWMLPASGAWPPELDVFEAYGGPWDIGTVHTATSAYGGLPGQDNYLQVWSDQPSMTTGFHTYGVMWDPQHITFYFDGNVTGQLPTPPDMHQPMYLLADLAMQTLSGVTSDPKHFSIDYIRAYSNDPNATAVPLAPISSPDGVDTSGLYGAQHASSFPFSGDSQSQVEMIYIAYFGRAGDPDGTNFWINELNAGGDTVVPGLTGVAAAYSLAPEASTEYPLLANPSTASQPDIQTFINAIYQNLFNRAADSAGLAYWTAEVNEIIATHNSLTIANGIGQMAVSIALAAQGTDQTSLANKVTVAEWLTQQYQAAGVHTFPTQSAEFAFSHSLIASVTSDPATVIGAEMQHIPLM